jgi:hypothetical protein
VPKEQLRFNETGYDGDVLTVFSRQIGLPREDWVEDFGLPDWAGDNESTLGHSATRAAEINDDESLLRAGREKLLVDLFAMNGITLSFFN